METFAVVISGFALIVSAIALRFAEINRCCYEAGGG